MFKASVIERFKFRNLSDSVISPRFRQSYLILFCSLLFVHFLAIVIMQLYVAVHFDNVMQCFSRDIVHAIYTCSDEKAN